MSNLVNNLIRLSWSDVKPYLSPRTLSSRLGLTRSHTLIALGVVAVLAIGALSWGALRSPVGANLSPEARRQESARVLDVARKADAERTGRISQERSTSQAQKKPASPGPR